MPGRSSARPHHFTQEYSRPCAQTVHIRHNAFGESSEHAKLRVNLRPGGIDLLASDGLGWHAIAKWHCHHRIRPEHLLQPLHQLGTILHTGTA